MLTDVFFRRYEDRPLFNNFTSKHQRFLFQVSQLITEEVLVPDPGKYSDEKDDRPAVALAAVHMAIARELGVDSLSAYSWKHTWNLPNGNPASRNVAYSVTQRSKLYLTLTFEGHKHAADSFLKQRISFVELVFQARATLLKTSRTKTMEALNNRAVGSLVALMSDDWAGEQRKKLDDDDVAFARQIQELNARFQQADRGGSVCLDSLARLLSGAPAGFMPLREAVG